MPQGKKNYRHQQRSDDGSQDSRQPEGFRQLRIHDSRHSRKPVARPATAISHSLGSYGKKYRLLMSVTTFICSHMMFLNEQASWQMAVGRRAVFSCCRARGFSFGRGACSWRRSCDGRRRLAFLEKRLGVKLLNRTPDGFVVTPAGQAILRQSAAMEEAALDLERAAAGRDLLAAGSVRITTTEALAYRIIVPATASLLKSHPDLHVVVLAGVHSLD